MANPFSEPARRNYIDSYRKKLFQSALQSCEVEQTAPRFQIDQQIDIALRVGFASGHRSEHPYVGGTALCCQPQNGFPAAGAELIECHVQYLTIRAAISAASYFGGCQFCSRWMGSVVVSCKSVLIRKRPSRDTSYCCLLIPGAGWV